MKKNHVVQPYLNFDGRCQEALEFYGRALGAHVLMLMHYKDSPEQPKPGSCAPPPGDKVMHASFRIGATTLMASDGHCKGKPEFHGISLSLTVDTEAEASQSFAALAEGGEVEMPLGKTFFSPSFGMVTDRFGLLWMVIVAQEGTH